MTVAQWHPADSLQPCEQAVVVVKDMPEDFVSLPCKYLAALRYDVRLLFLAFCAAALFLHSDALIQLNYNGL